MSPIAFLAICILGCDFLLYVRSNGSTARSTETIPAARRAARQEVRGARARHRATAEHPLRVEGRPLAGLFHNWQDSYNGAFLCHIQLSRAEIKNYRQVT
jgi:hypothetical protein